MLDIANSISTEKRKYGNTTTIIYIFKCITCNNTIKSEKKYLTKHSGKCRNCCQRGLPFLSTYNHLKDSIKRTNAKRSKQKEFNLSYEDFLTFTKEKECHYCGKILTWNKHTGEGRYKTNLDRKDSSKGYNLENCVACCKECNLMKNVHFSYEEFKAILKLLQEMRHGT